MTLRLRHLRLRAVTPVGPYGTDITFSAGLNVIWADNTKGKSTCMQGMLYALGMEKMLSPRREVPLPHAMTTFLKSDDETVQPVLESIVSLEMQNGSGRIITVHRPVKKQGIDNRIVMVDFGPTLTEPELIAERRQFFVSDAGAAQREAGFHRFLEDFIGWNLPSVRRYDGPECKLYIETIFPLFWVEQKVGWSAIPAAIPTYFRIREVHKRAVEFLMDLDVPRLELERQRLQERLDQNTREWRTIWDEVDHHARLNFAKIDGLPAHPTLTADEIRRSRVLIDDQGGLKPLGIVLEQLRKRIADLSDEPIPAVSGVAAHLEHELTALNKQVEALNRSRIEVHKAKQLKEADVVSLQRRIETLTYDLHKNQDVQKLQRYSGSDANLTPHRCPTCEQALVDSLLSQLVIDAVMPIDENIEYIRSQLRMFENILARENGEVERLLQKLAQTERALSELYSRIRVVRADLVAPTSSPSAAAIEERVRAEARVRDLEAIQSGLDDAVEKLTSLASKRVELLALYEAFPKDRMSQLDKRKLDALTSLLQRRAQEFGFSTFDPNELTIDEDSYRPQKEGYEIGFETSASDAIRLKWAYQLALMELDQQLPTNHPGVLVLDEPRQQSSSRVSFGKLLERAAAHQTTNQQVIVSTSEDLDTLTEIVSQIEASTTILPGYALKPIA
ncbi:hypothetical protein SLNSH_21825 [Alsobacter soli]|uniref:Uncharacterized protein n=1 Tax=Alsobacter soli TaxID=2109933 RepID=A0A2T1HMG5_9HYPH|nr:AAA family ATPase [Alsobacter soli]PSC02840.1 hypothetical protein SLNSH_21825 [Alsobacter soli]